MSSPEVEHVKESKKASSKVKKDKSSKRKASKAVEESTPLPSSDEPVKVTKSMKEKSKKKSNVVEAIEEVVPAEEEITKPKKDKSSKKRKAEELADDLPAGGSEEPETTAQPSESPSKKRKASLEEIEVDITLPEPPSKKALRLLKKGKPLPPSKSGAESTPEPEPKKKAEVEKRSEHGIWIGNLPWHISKADVRKFFVDYSDLTDEMITRIHMPGPNDKKPANKVEDSRKFVKPIHNKGFAYVDFSTAEAAEKAVELSEQLLSGRAVLIKNNKSFEGRPEKTKEESRAEGKPPSRKIFLGNLSFDTTEEQLTEHFSKCGTIGSVKVATFEDSGKCKGYGWIEFEDVEFAKSAVKGFVMIEEDLSDIDSESEIDSDADVEAEPKAKKPTTKKRKWWVNTIKGRKLKIEFAEDAQVRYKKRYGKEGTKRVAAAGEEGEGEGKPKWERGAERVEKEKPEYMLPYGGPQLTGGIVKATGTKVTF